MARGQFDAATDPASPGEGLTGSMTAVVLAVAVACLLQGGYYLPGRAALLALLVVAALLGPLRIRERQTALVLVPASALVTWVVAQAAMNGLWLDALLPTSTVAIVVLAFLVTSSAQAQSAARLVQGLVVVGGVVAAAGWWGVVVHAEPWADRSQGLWRAAAGTTYPNATGALLVVLALVAAAALPVSPRGAAMTTVLMAGAGATLSRGAALALVAGVVCLVVLRRREALAALLPVVIGTAVVLVGLLPSMPAGRAPGPILASAAAASGLAVAALLARVRLERRRFALIVLGTGAVAATVLAIPVLQSRVTLDSPRWDTWRAAWESVMLQPWIGTGPGRLTLSWVDAEGAARGTTLVHNEWLQTLAELGVVGAVLVLALCAALVLPAMKAWAADRSPLSAGALAAAVAFAVASTFDFLWHVPVVPAVLAAVLGAASVRSVSSGDDASGTVDLAHVVHEDHPIG